jgi:hypothetical protein
MNRCTFDIGYLPKVNAGGKKSAIVPYSGFPQSKE